MQCFNDPFPGSSRMHQSSIFCGQQFGPKPSFNNPNLIRHQRHGSTLVEDPDHRIPRIQAAAPMIRHRGGAGRRSIRRGDVGRERRRRRGSRSRSSGAGWGGVGIRQLRKLFVETDRANSGRLPVFWMLLAQRIRLGSTRWSCLPRFHFCAQHLHICVNVCVCVFIYVK